MINELSQLLDLDRENELSSLEPASDSDVMTIAELYPNVSKQYLEFIRKVSTGSTARRILKSTNRSLSVELNSIHQGFSFGGTTLDEEVHAHLLK